MVLIWPIYAPIADVLYLDVFFCSYDIKSVVFEVRLMTLGHKYSLERTRFSYLMALRRH